MHSIVLYSIVMRRSQLSVLLIYCDVDIIPWIIMIIR